MDGKKPDTPKKRSLPMMLMAVWLIALTVLLVFFMGRPGSIENRFKILEGKSEKQAKTVKKTLVTHSMEGLEKRIVLIERKLSGLENRLEKIIQAENVRGEEHKNDLKELMEKLEHLEAVIQPQTDLKTSAVKTETVKTAPETNTVTAGYPPGEMTDVPAIPIKKRKAPKKRLPLDSAEMAMPENEMEFVTETAPEEKHFPGPKTLPERKAVRKKGIPLPEMHALHFSGNGGKPLPPTVGSIFPSHRKSHLSSVYDISLRFGLSYGMNKQDRRIYEKLAPGAAIYPLH